MDFISKFVEKVDLLKITNISFYYICNGNSNWLLLLNSLGSNFMAQKDPRTGDQEAS